MSWRKQKQFEQINVDREEGRENHGGISLRKHNGEWDFWGDATEGHLVLRKSIKEMCLVHGP